MNIGKWLLITGVTLILTAQGALAAPEHSIQTILNGTPLDPQVRVIRQEQNYYINHPILSKYLNMITAWNIEAHDLFLKLGKTSIKLYANDTSCYMNGKNLRLKNAPFEKDGQFWLPLQFLTEIGLDIKSIDQRRLILDWKHNYLLGIETTTYQTRPAYLFIGTQNLKINAVKNRELNQLVLHLPGVTSHFSMSNQIKTDTGALIKQVKIDQSDPKELKLVFELNQAVNYQLIPLQDQPNRVLLVFNYFLTEIQNQGDERKILIKTSAPAQYQVTDEDATRLKIDLTGATLIRQDNSIEGDGNWCRNIQLTQLNPQVVRLVINLLQPTICNIFQPPENPNLLEIRPVHFINIIEWRNTTEGGELHIVADGELTSALTQLKTDGQLILDLPALQLKSELEVPNVSNNLVTSIVLQSINQSIVRLRIQLNCQVSYNVTYSTDRKELVLHFNSSQLIGKTIVIDPGHGGEDNGAWGRQIQEKNVNLEVAMHLKDLLEAAGAAVILTRTDDYFVGLYERAFLANYSLADLFISIHSNNHPDLSVHGIEVFHFPNRNLSALLARNVLTEITQSTRFIGLGVKQDNFVVIRESQMPSILVEVGYLSNFQEENMMKTPDFKEKAAFGIYQGILDYYHK